MSKRRNDEDSFKLVSELLRENLIADSDGQLHEAFYTSATGYSQADPHGAGTSSVDTGFKFSAPYMSNRPFAYDKVDLNQDAAERMTVAAEASMSAAKKTIEALTFATQNLLPESERTALIEITKRLEFDADYLRRLISQQKQTDHPQQDTPSVSDDDSGGVIGPNKSAHDRMAANYPSDNLLAYGGGGVGT